MAVQGNTNNVGFSFTIDMSQVHESLAVAGGQVVEFGEQLDDVGNDMNQMANKEFPSWALSLLFLGLAMKRVFNNITQAGAGAFQEISNSVENNRTAFDELQGALQFLWFTVGAALEPFVPVLIEIIEKVTEWISNNDDLFAMGVILLGIVGHLFAIIGTFATAKFALIQFLSIFGGSKVILSTFAKIFTVAFAKITLIILVVIALWKQNFAGFRDRVTEIWESLTKNVTRIFEGLSDVLGGVWNVLMGVLEGDWSKAWEGIKSIFVGIIKILLSVAEFFISSTISGFRFLFDFILTVLERVLDSWLWTFEKMAEASDAVLGTNFSKNFTKARDLISSVANDIRGLSGDVSSYLQNATSTGIDAIIGLTSGEMTLQGARDLLAQEQTSEAQNFSPVSQSSNDTYYVTNQIEGVTPDVLTQILQGSRGISR